MKQLLQQPQKLLAKAFLLLFPFSTILIYREPMVNGYKWEYGILGFYGIEIIGWLCIMTVLFQLIRRVKKERLSFTWTTDRLFVSAMLLFLLYSGASLLWGVDIDLAQQQSIRLMFAAVLFLTLPMVLSQKEIVQTLAIGALLPICIGLYQFFSQTLPGSKLLGMSGRDIYEGGVSVVQFGKERWLRAYGTFAHPNIFGGYLVMVILGLLVSLKDISRRFSNGLLLLAGTALMLTMSRSAWSALALGVMIIWYFGRKNRSVEEKKSLREAIIVLAVTMVALTVLFWPLVSVRLGVTSYHEKVSIAERAALQDTAMDIFNTAPVFGVGTGNMTAALIQTDDSKFGYVYQPVHNVFLLLLVEYGIAGMLLMGGLIFLGGMFFGRGGYLVFAALPLLLFDHYLLTSVHGLGIGAISLSILVLSTQNSATVGSKRA